MTDHLDPSDSASPSRPDQWDAIARFLAGESSAGDAADVRQWLGEHPGDAQVVAALDALLPANAQDAQVVQRPQTGTLPFGRPIDVEGALRRVHVQMEEMSAAPTLALVDVQQKNRSLMRTRSVAPKRTFARAGWATAAAVLVAVAGMSRSQGGGDAPPAVAKTYVALVGASDSVLLSDSTRVILAPGSKMTVPASYGTARRDVQLVGDAQFTVRHDARHPFTVRSGAAIINDLGTVFTIKAVAGKGVVVAVTEGSVTLSDSLATGVNKAITLKAGDRGRLGLDGVLVSEQGSVTPDETAWVLGKLVYRDASLAEVQTDLRRWYGVELVVRDSEWRAQTITTQGLSTEPVSKLVGSLAVMYGGGVVTSSGDTLFVDRRGDRPRH